MKVSFTVPGTPQAKLRHRTFVTKYGHQRQYTPGETVMYENMVKLCCREALHEQAQPKSVGAVRVAARYYFQVPKSRAGRLAEGDRHTQKPDLDNLVKSTKDGCNEVAWNDDCCVAELTAAKYWTYGEPKADITIEEL